jgi:methyl-accepting chemotaxis protein
MDAILEVGILMAVLVCCIALCGGCAASVASIRQRTNPEGAETGELINREQQEIGESVNSIREDTEELRVRVEGSVESVDTITKGIDRATGYSGEIATGIEEGVILVNENGERLEELANILRELEKRTGLTEGLGDEAKTGE